jgi:hypothetical protein
MSPQTCVIIFSERDRRPTTELACNGLLPMRYPNVSIEYICRMSERAPSVARLNHRSNTVDARWRVWHGSGNGADTLVLAWHMKPRPVEITIVYLALGAARPQVTRANTLGCLGWVALEPCYGLSRESWRGDTHNLRLIVETYRELCEGEKSFRASGRTRPVHNDAIEGRSLNLSTSGTRAESQNGGSWFFPIFTFRGALSGRVRKVRGIKVCQGVFLNGVRKMAAGEPDHGNVFYVFFDV